MAAASSRNSAPVSKRVLAGTAKATAGPAKAAHPVTPAKVAAKSSPAKATPAKAPAASATPAATAVKALTPTPAKAAPKPRTATSTGAGAAGGGSSNGKTAPVKKATASRPTATADLWSTAELAGVRGELVAELTEMQGEYNRSMDELNALHQTGTDGAGDDQADAGSKTFEREQELSIAANRLDLLNQIQRAIERVDAGTYGMCESCGNPIPKARLKAFPMATLDVACKQREERR
jgi:RNA polymerase-binding protein DksA